MEIEVKIDPGRKENKIVIYTARMSEEIQLLIDKLSEQSMHMITGFLHEKLTVLDQDKIIRVYADTGKVYAQTEDGKYTLRLRLYEAEERLDRNDFVRISHSEIINIRKTRHFDFGYTGTIHVELSDGSSAWVSRRYVGKIKKILGI
ncbi:MAG: LytTR family transcriptional regulator [Tissierellia bacterium]|mgnify:CR=1 FL=1|nr:LytTR family DNA-binding domain-containing protein [Bacillota bacterium]NLL22342.1 LytTR family transcriptional regulator [Tissierellia bacterium]